jgi:hypothetical protein
MNKLDDCTVLVDLAIQQTNELQELVDQMEKLVGAPREEYGKRQPGERGKYETYVGSIPRDTEGLPVQ